MTRLEINTNFHSQRKALDGVILYVTRPLYYMIDLIAFLQQSFLEELEKTVALLAFEDVSNCPVGELLDVSQRLKTASEVNAAILTSQSHEKG